MSFRTLAELAPLAAVALLGWLLPSIPASVWALPSRLLRRFTRTRARAVLWSALLTYVACALLSWLNPPVPRVVDEFSYLLASDTFAHGRLTNPPHPLGEHFEALHVLPAPTYQSKYPPGQGLFLAAGQALTGRPIVGVWLSMAAGAAALCWMLLAWMPPRWALLGALLPAFRFGSLALWDENWFAYWATTYWGGAVGLLGGALVFGALPRLLGRARPRDAALLGLGLIVLANSRPFEGLAAAIPAAIVLCVWASRRWRAAARAAAAVVAVVAAGFAAMGYYNYRGTGDPLKMPYVLYTERYDVAPVLVFGELRTGKTFHHESMRAYHAGFVVDGYRLKRGGAGLSWAHVELAPKFFWGFALWLPVLFAFSGPLRRWSFLAALVVILSMLASAASSYADKLRPHYIAPAAPLFVFLAVAGLRQLRALRFRGRRLGRPVAEAIVVISLLSVALGSAFRIMYGAPYEDSPLLRDKPAMAAKLLADGGMDLVLVHYAPDHNTHDEWVYNGADLEGAPIVWARDLGDERNRRLLDYYSGRKVWKLYADEQPPRLEPYSER
ncbi:MAG: hypothetical protein WD733_05005 [Bryobacterales bacterium]